MSWRDVRLVAGREAGEKLRSKSFLLSTLFFLVLVAASIALPGLLADDGPPQVEVAAVGQAAAELLEAVPPGQLEVTVEPAADDAAADRLVRDEQVDAALVVVPEGAVLTGLQEVPPELVEAVTAAAQVTRTAGALEQGGASPQEVQRLLAPPPVQQRVLDDEGPAAGVVTALGFVFALLFFFVVYQFGFVIAQGVVLEKESRIVELLVSAVPVRTLLYGKVLGIGGLALGQIVLLVAVATGGAAATGEGELLGLLVRNAPWFVLFFALGFALLSCLWAAAGAFAARSEDLQSTTLPLTVLMIVPFLVAGSLDEGPVRTALSYVPLSSPLLMPARLLEGDAAAWEAAVAALLLLVTAAGAVLLGERLYRMSLLRTRGTTSLAQALTGRVADGS